MKLNQWQNIFHVIVNANSIVQHVIQKKNGIIKHVNVNVKVIKSVKKILLGILAHVFVRIVNNLWIIYQQNGQKLWRQMLQILLQ